ncbi:MAG TPA: pitrilysin family protein [Acidimicrobiales bacterium]|nr:pitrilysin family protein [Acidimicrobiales bacterium]
MIRTDKLGSGLALVTEQMADARSVCLGFWVGTGSRDEPVDRAGTSHVLEHLLFKGTEDRSASSIAEAVDEVGGDFNAFTAKEYTSFYIRLLAEHLPLGLDILSDIMWRPALRDSDLDAERSVILDEILMHADEPSDLAAEQSSAILFPDHPLGRDVLGSHQSIEAMTAAKIREFFDQHYRSANMVAAIAGDLEHDAVVAGLEARFTGSSGGSTPVRTAPSDTVIPLQVTRRGTEQAQLILGMRSVDRFDPRRYPLAILNHVLGGGLSSRLFQEIRERRGLAYSVWSDRVTYYDAGVLSVGMGTSPEHVSEVLKIVVGELEALGADGITERELAVAKGNLRAESVLACEDSGARMGRIGAGWLLHGEVLTIDQVVARVEAVTLEEVHAVATELLAAPRTLSVVGPFDASDFDADSLGVG